MKYSAFTIAFVILDSNCIILMLVSHSFQVFAHKNIAVACYASHLWEQQVHALSVSHILFTLQVDHKLSLLSVLSKVDIIRYFYLVIASCASC